MLTHNPLTPMIKNLVMALQWRQEIDSGEMIEQCHNGLLYTRHFLSFPGTISQQELEAICASANLFFKMMKSPLRIANSMGELLPAKI